MEKVTRNILEVRDAQIGQGLLKELKQCGTYLTPVQIRKMEIDLEIPLGMPVCEHFE